MTEQEKINSFWNWFSANNEKFLFLNDVDDNVKEELLDEFMHNLHQYYDNLYFEIGGHPKDKKIELIITAEGILEHFPKVEKLIDSAPEIKGWRFIKFRQPHGPGFTTSYRGKTFDPDKIIFIPLTSKKNPTGIGLQICYPDYQEDERNIFVNGSYIMLDSLIGEKSVTLDIDYLDVGLTPENIADYDFKHICDLGDYIRRIKNTQGNIS